MHGDDFDEAGFFQAVQEMRAYVPSPMSDAEREDTLALVR